MRGGAGGGPCTYSSIIPQRYSIANCLHITPTYNTAAHHALIQLFLNSILFAIGTHLVRQRVYTDDDPPDDIKQGHGDMY